MQPSEKCSGDASVRLLKAFFEVRRIALTPDALRMWLDAIGDLSPDQLVDAVRRFNRESTEYPTPAAVRRYAGSVAISLEDRARIAWAKTWEAVRHLGAYESLDFDDPLINATIRSMGGWERLCEVQSAEIQWTEKAFIETYKAIGRSGLGDASPLPGIHARTNGTNGFEPPSIKRITCELSEHPLARRLVRREFDTKRLSAAGELATALTVPEK